WMSPVEYLDSETSALNPYNRGYSFYVYGNLPMTIVRVAGEAMSKLEGRLLGRQFSALMDLFTILLLYLIVSRLYDRRVALLASLFSTLAAMQIQQSHFFTPDLFVNAFAFLAIFFAVKILTTDPKSEIEAKEAELLRSKPVAVDSGSTELPSEEAAQAEPQPVHDHVPAFDLRSLLTNRLFLYS